MKFFEDRNLRKLLDYFMKSKLFSCRAPYKICNKIQKIHVYTLKLIYAFFFLFFFFLFLFFSPDKFEEPTIVLALYQTKPEISFSGAFIDLHEVK